MPVREDDYGLTDKDAWRRVDATSHRQQRLAEHRHMSLHVRWCTDFLVVSTISWHPQFSALCVTAYE